VAAAHGRCATEGNTATLLCRMDLCADRISQRLAYQDIYLCLSLNTLQLKLLALSTFEPRTRSAWPMGGVKWMGMPNRAEHEEKPRREPWLFLLG
jgi:hypothetical protein